VKKINIFCFGFGQVAKNFVKKIYSQKLKINLSVTSTSKTFDKKFCGVKYKNYYFKNNSYDTNLEKKLKKSDYILISIPPLKGEDLVLKHFSKKIESYKPKWVTYLSATSVYGDHKGKWVNEKSLTRPTSSNGIARLKVEKSWLELVKIKKLPIQIFRLSGIYSNTSNVLVRLKKYDAFLIKKRNHFFSRIHVKDIADVLFKSLSKFKSGEIYNISDDTPASSFDVTLYGAKLLNISKPKVIKVSQIKSKILKNFYKDSKRVSNKKMKKYFNHNLNFPSYKEGLDYERNNLA